MKLDDDIHLIKVWWKIEKISHKKLLWESKQIIRLPELIYNKVNNILVTNSKSELNLFNHYNEKNSDLIKEYRLNQVYNNWAIIAKIIESTEQWPILDIRSFIKIKISEMYNINLKDITSNQLSKSVFDLWEDISVENLLMLLSKELYNWNYSIEEILSYKKLFFRQIKLK